MQVIAAACLLWSRRLHALRVSDLSRSHDARVHRTIARAILSLEAARMPTLHSMQQKRPVCEDQMCRLLLQAALRSGLKDARISSTKIFGCSHAAK
jgi:hypothetical protein